MVRGTGVSTTPEMSARPERPGSGNSGALQSVDKREEIVGIRWISAIGRFHRTQGDGWPRTCGQVKHEGSQTVLNRQNETYQPDLPASGARDWPLAGSRRNIDLDIDAGPCYEPNAPGILFFTKIESPASIQRPFGAWKILPQRFSGEENSFDPSYPDQAFLNSP